jgi:hypothetical protein
MEIDLQGPNYPSDHYAVKMQSLIANIYTRLTDRLKAMKKLVSELATWDRVATSPIPGLIIQYWQCLQKQHTIY